MEEQAALGKATALSSLFPVDDSQRASKHMQDAIVQRQKELAQLRGFIADNNSLINLVQRLPDELNHQIMVPFGKAAFFPGQLIHTNEFMVLLGENYYTERTAKQTIEILKRRGKQLDSQLESFKAVMEDLKTEASFFDTMASEAAEGFVEIKEHYVEEIPNEDVQIAGTAEPAFCSSIGAGSKNAEDEEFARILSRIEELEKEEQEEEEGEEEGGEEEDEEYADNCNKFDQDNLGNADLVHSVSQLSVNDEASDASKSAVQQKSDNTGKESFGHGFQQVLSNQLNCLEMQLEEGSKQHSVSKGRSAHGSPNFSGPSLIEKYLKRAEENEQSALTNRYEVRRRTSEPAAVFDSTKAFTGSIIERTANPERNSKEETAPRSSKPASRFKSQRR